MPSLLGLDAQGRELFTGKLLDWFSLAQRPLPWRKDYLPYHVWISEIMLQQTQMERGVAYFNAWLQRFPDIQSVAEAGENEIMKAWEGLGYYSRARNLHAAAKVIMGQHKGRFPEELAAIRALPGIGEYTAGAIASIAFNQPVSAVDANVMRIFSRLCDIDVPLTGKDVKAFINEAVMALMPQSSPRLFNQALMEFGALLCTKAPACALCPLVEYCEAFRIGTVAERPLKDKGKGYRQIHMATGVIRNEGKLFIQKRPAFGVWAGLWEFPGGSLDPGESPEQAVVREVFEETELRITVQEKIGEFQHAYTTNRVTMHAFLCTLEDEEAKAVLHAACEGRWVGPEELSLYAFPAGQRKMLEYLKLSC